MSTETTASRPRRTTRRGNQGDPAALIPRFATADQVPIGEPLPEPLQGPHQQEHPQDPNSRPNPLDVALDGVRAVGGPPPTATSSAGKWRGSGDPIATAKVFGGLLTIALSTLALVLRRRSVAFRQPDSEQLDDIVSPLARIACRHLPMDAIGPDLGDFALSASAIHSYATDPTEYPLFRREIPEGPPGLPEVQ